MKSIRRTSSAELHPRAKSVARDTVLTRRASEGDANLAQPRVASTSAPKHHHWPATLRGAADLLTPGEPDADKSASALLKSARLPAPAVDAIHAMRNGAAFTAAEGHHIRRIWRARVVDQLHAMANFWSTRQNTPADQAAGVALMQGCLMAVTNGAALDASAHPALQGVVTGVLHATLSQPDALETLNSEMQSSTSDAWRDLYAILPASAMPRAAVDRWFAAHTRND